MGLVGDPVPGLWFSDPMCWLRTWWSAQNEDSPRRSGTGLRLLFEQVPGGRIPGAPRTRLAIAKPRFLPGTVTEMFYYLALKPPPHSEETRLRPFLSQVRNKVCSYRGGCCSCVSFGLKELGTTS